VTDLLQLADRVERDEIKALSIKQPYRKQPRCKDPSLPLKSQNQVFSC